MKTSTWIAVALAAAGCAGGPIAGQVRDEDLARIGGAKGGQVRDAGQELEAARQELAAARTRLADARKQEKAGEAERDSAEDELEKASRAAAAAEARARAAKAGGEYAEKRVEAAEAEETAAKLRLEVASAKVELEKLQALEKADAPVLVEYDRGAFYERVARSQRELDDATKEALEADREAKAAQRVWEQLARKVPRS